MPERRSRGGKGRSPGHPVEAAVRKSPHTSPTPKASSTGLARTTARPQAHDGTASEPGGPQPDPKPVEEQAVTPIGLPPLRSRILQGLGGVVGHATALALCPFASVGHGVGGGIWRSQSTTRTAGKSPQPKDHATRIGIMRGSLTGVLLTTLTRRCGYPFGCTASGRRYGDGAAAWLNGRSTVLAPHTAPAPLLVNEHPATLRPQLALDGPRHTLRAFRAHSCRGGASRDSFRAENQKISPLAGKGIRR